MGFAVDWGGVLRRGSVNLEREPVFGPEELADQRAPLSFAAQTHQPISKSKPKSTINGAGQAAPPSLLCFVLKKSGSARAQKKGGLQT